MEDYPVLELGTVEVLFLRHGHRLRLPIGMNYLLYRQNY